MLPGAGTPVTETVEIAANSMNSETYYQVRL